MYYIYNILFVNIIVIIKFIYIIKFQKIVALHILNQKYELK